MDVLGLVAIPNWLLAIVVMLITFYIYMTWRFGELKALGVPHDKPLPFMGTIHKALDKKVGMMEIDRVMMKKYGKIWGAYDGRDPIIWIGDVDILKQVLVKDFHNFVNRRKMYLRGIFKHGVFDAEGAHWKHIRSLVTPAFTSGKLKQMTDQMADCSSSLVKNLSEVVQSGESFDIKEYTSAFTLDVIARIAFGLKLDTQKDEVSEFTKRAKMIFDGFSIFDPLVLVSLFMSHIGKVLDWFGFVAGDTKSTDFFVNMMNQTLKQRQEKTISQMDFIRLLMDAERHFADDLESQNELKASGMELMEERKGTGLTHDEIIAQCLLFLLAGYETTATTLQFLSYNFAVYPEVQEKAAREVYRVMDGRTMLRYEDITQLKYMDMCIEETLRIYPPVGRVDRRAAEAREYNGVQIPKDYMVGIPIRAMHMNPETWPDPEIFDPDRFLPEAKAARNPYNYLPFGLGPRNCIGMRVAQMEMKIAMANLLKNFKILKCDKTHIPLKLRNNFLAAPEGGVWVKMERRQA